MAIDRDRLRPLVALLRDGPVAVLTGAGLSAGSGLPTYRGPDGEWRHRKPILHQDFLRSEAVRRRYWARSLVGWPTMGGAEPNAGHFALATLERLGAVAAVITQNVDGLHHKAGSHRVIELHGGIAHVLCLSCGARHPRADVQQWLLASNPDFATAPRHEVASAPDGDAQLEHGGDEGFRVPDCPDCGGLLKPDVVFYGDGVPRERVAEAMQTLEQAAGLLVVGSSLMVYSGYRFADRAYRLGKPVIAINYGLTRADSLLSAKLDVDCADALHAAVGALTAASHAAPALVAGGEDGGA
ncbi:MAG: NAD-dependent protein deacetylase [Rhodocyclaceae bacterium]|nr:NAD-dependent protein deacetylase [Rhodocyclaceae bacterium]